jgi:hypothetical protein
MRDRFFEVPRSARATTEGPVDLPILYQDVTCVMAVFDAPLEGARALLEGTGLVPAVVLGDRTAALMAFYEYRRSTVGVYNEVGTGLFVVRRGEPLPRLGWADLLVQPRRRTIAVYVLDLPVTTAAANAAGREIWGYPKFVTRIPFHARGRDLDIAVEDPSGSGTIVALAGRLGPGLPGPSLDLMTYTFLDGALVRTHVDVRGPVTIHPAGSAQLAVGASSHRMAENLRALGLGSARPRLVTRTDRFQSILHEGTRVPLSPG